MNGHIVGAGTGLFSLDEAPQLHVGNHADHAKPRHVGPRFHDILGPLWQIHAPADRIGVGPEPLRELLVHDDDSRGIRTIRIRKQTPALERYFHRFEISGRHVQLIRRDDGLAGRHDVAFRNDDAAAPVPAEWQKARRSGSLDAWQRSNALERPRHVGAQRVIIAIPRLQRAHPSGEDVVGDKSGVDAKQPLEAGEKQAAADEQHERERDLRDDECAPDVSRASPCRAAAAFLPQDAAQAGAHQMHGRGGANDDAEEERQAQRKAEDRAVHPDLVHAGQIGQTYPLESIEAPEPDEQSQDSADHGQQRRFGDELPGDPAAAGADGAARCQFLHAPARPHERQVGDVDGGDQDDEEHAAPEEQQSGAHVAHEIGFERDHPGRVPRPDQRRLEGTRALHDLRVQRIDLRLCLLERHASRQPRNLFVVLAVAAILGAILGPEWDWNEHANVGVEKMEAVGQHADDVVELVVQAKLPADDTGDAAGLLRGKDMAQDRNFVPSRRPLLFAEQPACRRAHAEDLEERWRDVQRRPRLPPRLPVRPETRQTGTARPPRTLPSWPCDRSNWEPTSPRARRRRPETNRTN